MNKEEIIRDESREFSKFNLHFNGSAEPIDLFKKIAFRLTDFYTSDYQAIFLDEIKNTVLSNLKEHRDKAHGGEPGVDCGWEANVEKIMFYIDQHIETLPTVIKNNHSLNEDQEKRTRVFVSYSHSDSKYLDEIRKHFKPISKNIDFWDDSKLNPGDKWREEIDKAIDNSRVAILLLSADFLASDFIVNNELPPLLKAADEKGAKILIVILRPCLFSEIEQLNRYQALNPPSRPVSKMNENEREELYVNLVKQTIKMLKVI